MTAHARPIPKKDIGPNLRNLWIDPSPCPLGLLRAQQVLSTDFADLDELDEQYLWRNIAVAATIIPGSQSLLDQ
jgi:hypothetical protein